MAFVRFLSLNGIEWQKVGVENRCTNKIANG